tara:strand:- start:287 stop:616 length:330 start_codon:yes stop_codon:yes gene_type:complete
MSDTLTLVGTIKVIEDTQAFPSGFTKREFVITTPGEYPQDIKFEIVKDKCSLLDQYSIGQSITVDFNVRGNEYNGKYYVNLQAWKIANDGAPAQETAPAGVDDDQDIPF